MRNRDIALTHVANPEFEIVKQSVAVSKAQKIKRKPEPYLKSKTMFHNMLFGMTQTSEGIYC